MAGGIIQLAAYGVEDLYLTGDPQITFFKALYRRHTNFAFESIPQYFTSKPDFGRTVSCTISRAGDLIGQTHIYVEIPSIPKFLDPVTGREDPTKLFAWARNLGFVLIRDVDVEIGGRKIDKHYGEWLYIWSQLAENNQKAMDKMIGNVPELYQLTNGKSSYQLCIPLQFWFCRHSGLALPLVALAASDVRINVSFRSFSECSVRVPTHSIPIIEDIVPFERGDYIEQTIDGQTIRGYYVGYDYLQRRLYYNRLGNASFQSQEILNTSDLNSNNQSQINNSFRIYCTNGDRFYVTPQPNTREYIESIDWITDIQITNAYLLVDYIFLDEEERRRFTTNVQEYLIEQLQFTQKLNVTSSSIKIPLPFKHSCKEFYWVVHQESITSTNFNNRFGYSLGTDANIHLNGKGIGNMKNSSYYTHYQPYVHHSHSPTRKLGINSYSFALYPENHQPSSTVNMSLIDQAFLQLKFNSNVSNKNPLSIKIYALNYNILRITCGMGGISFV